MSIEFNAIPKALSNLLIPVTPIPLHILNRQNYLFGKILLTLN